MAFSVVSGACLMCSMGLAPSKLTVTSQVMVTEAGQPAATIQDSKPIMNISPFGMCRSIGNPQVASATAAAFGVLTPMACVPAPAGVWACGPTPLIGRVPSLSSDGRLMCAYGGVISITFWGQIKVME